ncbi:MAG: hypothetical protein JWM67_3054, partial [Mycobacterium sp.]|nr:hypothetical protein [Mycobacterium sp.]
EAGAPPAPGPLHAASPSAPTTARAAARLGKDGCAATTPKFYPRDRVLARHWANPTGTGT